MRRTLRRHGRVLSAGLACLVLASCSGDDAAEESTEATSEVLGFSGEQIATGDESLLASTVLGLDVEVEDVQERLTSVKDTYVEALTLFSLRRDDLLMATLQVSKLGGPARPDDPEFRREIIGLVGGAAPREVRLGDTTVWLSSGGSQRLQSWFRGDQLFILTIRADYERPRALLRELLEVQP